MTPLLALLLLPAAGTPAPLPGEAEAAAAYFEWEANLCRALIDVCDFPLAPPAPAGIANLRCRPGRSGTATCGFEVAGQSCRAHFVSAAAGPAHAWAMEWSSLPAAAAAGHAWAVAWTVSPAPRGPRIRCRGGGGRAR